MKLFIALCVLEVISVYSTVNYLMFLRVHPKFFGIPYANGLITSGPIICTAALWDAFNELRKLNAKEKP